MQLLVGTQTANLTIFGDYDVLLHWLTRKCAINEFGLISWRIGTKCTEGTSGQNASEKDHSATDFSIGWIASVLIPTPTVAIVLESAFRPGKGRCRIV
jgi:hypothetical protein